MRKFFFSEIIAFYTKTDDGSTDGLSRITLNQVDHVQSEFMTFVTIVFYCRYKGCQFVINNVVFFQRDVSMV